MSRGFNRYGMVRGEGQQRQGSPYLDRPQGGQPFGNEEDVDPAAQAERRRQNMLAALRSSQQPQQLNRDNINEVYGIAFDRAPSEDDIAVHMKNPGGYQGFLNTVRNSAEGQANVDRWKQLSSSSGAAAGATAGAGAPPPSSLPARGAAGDFSRMRGYDANNWGNMDSLKYRIGEIASRYAASPNGGAQFLTDPDLLAIAPNVRNISSGGKNDLFDFGGIVDPHSGARIGRVDMGLSFDPNNPDAETNWGWQDLDNDPSAGAGAAAPVFASGPNSSNPGGAREQLLRALLGGEEQQQQVSIEQILQSLLQGNEVDDVLSGAGLYSNGIRSNRI
jgi:hypothetical protein